MTAVKTVLAALVVSAIASAAPAAASETTFALRGADTAVSAQGEAKSQPAPAPAADAGTKKVRVVLASPYGG